MEDPLRTIWFMLVIIVVKGGVSLVETAFIASRKTWLRAKAAEPNKQYRTVLEVVENPLLFLSALRISTGFLRILAGVLGGMGILGYLHTWFASGEPVSPWGEYLAAVILTAVITLLMFILGDTLPKQIALIAPERITAGALPCMKVLVVICTPLTASSPG